MEIEEINTRPCLPVQKISFGLGHIFNDLCAAMWFSYTLFYLQVVLTIESTTAGTLLMVDIFKLIADILAKLLKWQQCKTNLRLHIFNIFRQVVDSLATPLAGWAIDYTGHRRLWHLAGTVAVSIGFSLIFSLKPTTFTTAILIYYISVITLFQIGWAIVQISHLSIIPEISRSHSHSSDLIAIRYTASVCCSLSVYLITLIILKNDEESNTIGPNDFYKFKEIALIITFIGILASLLFYCGLLGTQENEYELIREAEVEDANKLQNNGQHFLKSSIIYCVSLMYMASRLFTTLNLIYIPLYIDERSVLDAVEKERMRHVIASVPLVWYIASLLTAIFLKFRLKIFSDKITYLSGSLIGMSASLWVGVGVSPNSDGELYIIAVLLGISGSSTMVASLCLTANFVKTNGFGGGRIYSMVTFTDKLISGGVVLLVQNLKCTSRNLCPHFYENVLSYICGLVSLIGLLSLISLEIQIRKNMRKN